jgi:hypothetical protein
MTYGIMFWGNSSHAERGFKLQREMKILPLRSQYIYSLTMFVIKNSDIFDTNMDCYEINTTHNMNIHMNQVNLAKYGYRVYHTAVRIYNGLPNKLKANFNDPKQFEVSLKEFFYLNSFYTLHEYF